MSIQIDLGPEMEARLREEAAQHGQTAESLAAELVRQHLQKSNGKQGTASDSEAEEGESAYEALQEFIGCIDSSKTGGDVAQRPEYGDPNVADAVLEKYRKQGLRL